MAAKVTVLFFASIREQVGVEKEVLELPSGVGTVGALRAHLAARGGAWESMLSEKKPARAALNQEMVKANAPIKPGDEVAFFPPVTGG